MSVAPLVALYFLGPGPVLTTHVTVGAATTFEIASGPESEWPNSHFIRPTPTYDNDTNLSTCLMRNPHLVQLLDHG